MFEKQGRFYADWRDASGKRLRKSFKSKRAALQFEAEQKGLAHPKPKARGIRLPGSFSPHSSATGNGRTEARPRPSSPLRAVSRPTNSPHPTPKKSTTHSPVVRPSSEQEPHARLYRREFCGARARRAGRSIDRGLGPPPNPGPC